MKHMDIFSSNFAVVRYCKICGIEKNVFLNYSKIEATILKRVYTSKRRAVKIRKLSDRNKYFVDNFFPLKIVNFGTF